ncbi:MAG: transcription initiation factor IIE [Vallitalea sp.]|nr:transcription initiation factor IIE [Vallitalea sp.]
MKSKESYIGSKRECIDFFKSMLPKLFRGDLVLEGQEVFIPNGEELDYRVKYEKGDEYNYGSIKMKISWGEEPEDENEEEENDDDDDDDESEGKYEYF